MVLRYGRSRMESTTMSRPKVAAVRARVLVVEDEELVRDALGPLLERDGYEVSFAGNGREALQRLYTEAAPDLIVLDLRMPVMDGWEFRRQQQADPDLAPVPVIVLSALDQRRTGMVDAAAFIKKPLDFDRLIELVREHCR